MYTFLEPVISDKDIENIHKYYSKNKANIESVTKQDYSKELLEKLLQDKVLTKEQYDKIIIQLK